MTLDLTVLINELNVKHNENFWTTDANEAFDPRK